MIKRIIFDIDDTLILFPKNYIDGYNEVIKKYNLNITYKDLYDTIDKYESISKKFDKKTLVDFINQELNTSLDIDFVDYFIKIYNNLDIVLNDGVIDTLEFLYKKYELYALSNWFTSSQVARLKKCNILKYFTKVYGGDFYVKPDKNAYLNCCSGLNLSSCLMIGDSLRKDIIIPYKMGINVYYLNKNINNNYPSISKITDLKEVL